MLVMSMYSGRVRVCDNNGIIHIPTTVNMYVQCSYMETCVQYTSMCKNRKGNPYKHNLSYMLMDMMYTREHMCSTTAHKTRGHVPSHHLICSACEWVEFCVDPALSGS